MSQYKFELCTFITKDKGYWEYEDIEELKEQNGEEEIKDILGYFPSNSNITYDEINLHGSNTNWIVCYQDGETDIHQVETYGNTLDLLFDLDLLINKAYRNEHISIFNMGDMLAIEI